MKKWRKRLSCTLALYCLAGALTGCGGGNSSAETAAGQSQTEAMGQSSAASASDSTNVQENGSNEAEEIQQTQHITQQLDENLLIDADAVLPAKAQYSTYTLKMVDTDPDRLFAISCPDGYETYTAVDRGYMVYQESSGKQIVVKESNSYSAISYSAVDIDSAEVSDEEKAAFQEVGTLMYYHTIEYPQAIAHDLSFMTVAEMEEYGKALLGQIGTVGADGTHWAHNHYLYYRVAYYECGECGQISEVRASSPYKEQCQVALSIPGEIS